jgi:hypothetical protein
LRGAELLRDIPLLGTDPGRAVRLFEVATRIDELECTQSLFIGPFHALFRHLVTTQFQEVVVNGSPLFDHFFLFLPLNLSIYK